MQPAVDSPAGYSIGPIESQEWPVVADMIAAAIPNFIISHLGTAFGARFYRAIACQESSCALSGRDQTGRLADAQDVAALADSLSRLLDREDLRVRMGRAVRQRAIEGFRPKEIWAGVFAQYDELLPRHATS